MPGMKIVDLSNEPAKWSASLDAFSYVGVGHLIEWGKIIRRAYGMDSLYLAAVNGSEIRGLLPLVFVKSRIFHRALVSMPSLNDGGILAQDRETELFLWKQAITIMKNNNMSYIECRHTRDIDLGLAPRTDKISMILDLAGGTRKVWMNKLHGNVRNKVRKSKKMGVEIKEGPEWLEAFHKLHLINMKELGSPAHSLRFFKETANILKDRIKIYAATLGETVVGGKIVCYFKDTLYFLWISSPRKYLKYAVPSLLDWRAIEDAIKNGMRYCDFGRSTPGSSHYDFKKKWGLMPIQLYWHIYPPPKDTSKIGSYEIFSRLWRRLPLSVVKFVGPRLRGKLPH